MFAFFSKIRYHSEELFFFMTQKLFSFLKSFLILLALGLSSVLLFVGNVSANETVDNSRNMTSDEFIINLSELDPINKSKSTPQ